VMKHVFGQGALGLGGTQEAIIRSMLAGKT